MGVEVAALIKVVRKINDSLLKLNKDQRSAIKVTTE